MNPLYIEPILTGHKDQSISDFLSKKEADLSTYDSSRYNIEFNALLQEKRNCVFGEPGYGKSRLLQELYLVKSETGGDCAFIDLKQLQKRSILQCLPNDLEDAIQQRRNNFEASKIYFTSDFKLENSSNITLFLDALDEVQMELIPQALSEINDLLKTFHEVSIIMSCRTHHAQRFIKEFRLLNFKYTIISPFTPLQVAAYLKNKVSFLGEKSDNQVIELLDKYYRREGFFTWRSTLNTPRYLELFTSLIAEQSFDYVANLSRSEIFDQFINKRLEIEAKKRELQHPGIQQKIPYVKQCFQRLALVMEIQRTNTISKEDLASFEIDANLSISNQFALEFFYDGTILKDNGYNLEFDNTEFQEFLAAKAIKRLGKIDQIIFDIAIDNRLMMSYPSWLNTLNFLVEVEPKILSPVINFGIRHGDSSLFQLFNYSNPNNYTLELQEKIFSDIMTYHLERKQWLWNNTAKGISAFFNPTVHEYLLKSNIDDDLNFTTYFAVTHAAEIIQVYVERDKVNTKNLQINWSQIFLYFANASLEYGSVMHRSILSLLPSICTLEDFEKSEIHLNNSSSDIFKGVTNFYRQVAPNSANAIKHFFKVVEINHSLPYNSPFEEISTEEGFINLFNHFFDSETYQRLERSSYGDTDILSEKVVENIKQIYSPKIEYHLLHGVNQLVNSSVYRNEKIISNIVSLLKEQNEDVVSLLLNNFPTVDRYDDFAYMYGHLLSGLINNPEQLNAHLSILNSNEYMRRILRWIIISTKHNSIKNLLEIYFPEDILRWQENEKERDEINFKHKGRQEYRELKEFENFASLLKKKSAHVIRFFKEMSDPNKNKIAPIQYKKLKEIVINHLNDFNPLDTSVLVEKKEGGVTRVTHSWGLHYLKDAVLLLPYFNIKPQAYRQKILASLLFLYSIEDVKVAMDLVPKLQPSEVSEFIDNYVAKRDDDLITESIGRFVNLCSNIESFRAEANDFLKGLITDERVPSYTRIRILEILPELQENENFLLELFNHYSKEQTQDDSSGFLYRINEYLLKLENEDAVEWIIELILSKPYELTENTSPGGFARRTLDEEGLGRSLYHVKSHKFVSNVLKLLEESFILANQNKNYHLYINREIWGFAETYFSEINLTLDNKLDLIKTLSGLVDKYNDSHYVYWFSSRIDKIKAEYLKGRNEAITFGEATKMYLQLQQKQYLDIIYPNELFLLVQDVLNNELTNWVNQGAYKFIGTVQTKLQGQKAGRETLIQKTLVTQIENYLLKRGLRATDLTPVEPIIYREAQLLDDKRVDLIVTYGAIGSVMVEVKRMGNADLRNSELKEYKSKFMEYMNQTQCTFGVFLIFLDREKERNNFKNTLKKLMELYSEEEIKIIGIDCIR